MTETILSRALHCLFTGSAAMVPLVATAQTVSRDDIGRADLRRWGRAARAPSPTTTRPAAPSNATCAIKAVLNRYVNSAQSKVPGINIDARRSFKLPVRGTALFSMKSGRTCMNIVIGGTLLSTIR